MKGAFLFVLIVLCSIAVGQVTFTDYVTIDSFTVSSLLVVTYDTDDPFVPTLPYTQQVFKNTAGPTIVGGQRDNSITVNTAPTGASAYSNTVNNDVFSISTPTFGTGISILQYDGFDNSMNLDITTGLGGVDLTAGGLANRFHTQIGSDVDTLTTVQLYSGSAAGKGPNDYCYVDIPIPGATPLNIQDLYYSLDFSGTGFSIHGTGCDFTRINAVQVITLMQDSCDAIIGILSSYGPVPSPSPTISETPSITPSTTASVSISASSSRTPSVTPSPSASPSVTPSASPSPSYSASSTASVSISASSSRTASVTPSITPTPTITVTISESPSASISATKTRTSTVTPTGTQSPSVTPSVTGSTSVTPSQTPTISGTSSRSISSTKTRSASTSPSASSTGTSSRSATPSRSASASSTSSTSVTPSITPTASVSASPSATGSHTSSISNSASLTRSKTASVSKSPNYSASSSPSGTYTNSPSRSKSPSRTASHSNTATRSRSASASRSVGAPISTYVTTCSATALTIDQAFLNGWLTTNPNGACAHLATYDTEDEFNAIVQSIIDAGGQTSIIGGRRYSNSDYQWAAGTLRGQNWIEPWDSTSGDTFSRANCLQSFCLRDMNNALPITDASQVGMAVVVTDRQNPQLVPSSGAMCYTVEIATVSYIASVDGQQPYEIVPALADFDTHQSNAIRASKYLARVSSDVQNQWIKDELQCGTYHLWLGYETSTVSSALRLSAGPNEGMIIQDVGQTVCSGYYCNLPATPITLTDAAVRFTSTDGSWAVVPQSNTASGIRAYDVCALVNGNVPVCVPAATNNWLQYLPPSQASTQVALRNAFYAGGPYQKVVSGVTYLYYFDCRCQTDYRVNLACLGSSNPSLCTIYTP